jgi:rhodanese-related sulfurtransferase
MRRLSCIIIGFGAIVCFLGSCTAKPRKKLPVNQENLEHVENNQQNIHLLSPDDFEAQLKATPTAQLVDVRTPGEFNEGFIKGAVNINYQGETFTQDIARLDHKKPTFVYCEMGGRSSESCNFMANQGFTTLYQLDGGIKAWKHNKKPVELKK